MKAGMGPAVWELQKGLQRSWSLLWEGSQPARPVVLHLGDGHQQHGSPATTRSPTGIAEPCYELWPVLLQAAWKWLARCTTAFYTRTLIFYSTEKNVLAIPVLLQKH